QAATDTSVGSVTDLVQSGDAIYVLGQGGNTLYQLDGTNLLSPSVEAAVAQTPRSFGGTLLLTASSLSGASNGVNGATALALYSSDGTDFLYATSASANTISTFTGRANTLTWMQTLQEGENGVRGLVGPSGVSATADGRFVLATGETVNSVVVFDRDAATGTLQFVQVLRNNVGGTSGIAAPDAIVTDSTGAFAYVASLGEIGEQGGMASFD